MKKTLLAIVQDILSDMDSFDVNSINDTEESMQVATIVKNCYFDLIAGKDWPHLRRTIKLDSAVAATPTHLKLPDYVLKLKTFLYNKKEDVTDKDSYLPVKYMEPEEFLLYCNSRDSTSATVDSITDFGGVTLLIRNDLPPSFWTSFDDEYIVCDAYDSGVDSFLQNSKTQAVVYKAPTWTHSDSSYPDLPADAFPYLEAEAKSTAFLVLKKTAHEKAEQNSNRHRRNMAQEDWAAHELVRYPNYARKPLK